MTDITKEYPFGFISVKCRCGQELIFKLEHYYSLDETNKNPPSSYLHGECPICNHVHNVKVEVWD